MLGSDPIIDALLDPLIASQKDLSDQQVADRYVEVAREARRQLAFKEMIVPEPQMGALLMIRLVRRCGSGQ